MKEIDNEENDNQALVSCDEYDGLDKCIYFKEGNIEIIKNIAESNYYINNKLVANYIEFDDIKVIDDNYVLINYSAESSMYQLYDTR